MKEVYQFSNINKINTKYKMQLCIPHTFIIVMDFYNRDHFIQYVLQDLISIDISIDIEFYSFLILHNLVHRKIG